MVTPTSAAEELLFQGRMPAWAGAAPRAKWKPPERRAVTAGWEELLQNAKIDFRPGRLRVPDVEAFQPGLPVGLGKAQPTGLLPYQASGEARRLTEEQPLSPVPAVYGLPGGLHPQRRRPCSGPDGRGFWAACPAPANSKTSGRKMSLCYYCSTGMGAATSRHVH